MWRMEAKHLLIMAAGVLILIAVLLWYFKDLM
jgi:hypothetical protein